MLWSLAAAIFVSPGSVPAITNDVFLDTLDVTLAPNCSSNSSPASRPKFGVTEYVGDPDVSLSVALMTAAILGLTGLVAGYFPAKDASRLDPVVAMKL